MGKRRRFACGISTTGASRAVPETGFISVNGASLEFERFYSRESGPALVLLHEGLGCVATWKTFPERLHKETGREVIAYSRAGYGRSSGIQLPRPLDFHTREALDVVPAVLDEMSIRNFIFVGHSDGASIALIYAGVCPSPRIRGLVLIAPHVFAERQGIETIAKIQKRYETSDLRKKLSRYHGDNVECAFRGWSETWLDPGFSDWNIESHLPHIKSPVLTLRGNDDPYSTSEHVQRIAAGVSGPVDVCGLADCAHAPHLEQPLQTRQKVVDFVEWTAR